MTILWGTHIGLRPFADPLTDDQLARVYRWSRDEELLRLSGGTPTELTFEEFRNRLHDENRHVTNHRRAFFIAQRDGELIGRLGIFAIDWNHQHGELGIMIGEPNNWSKGYGREAVTLLLRHVFETTPLLHINLYTFPENVRAQRCFAACGFRTIGTAKRFSPDLGEYDGVEMEISRREFLEREKTHAANNSSLQGGNHERT